MVEQQIEEYVLQNSKNLEMAESIYVAMEKIRDRLLDAFLDHVKFGIHKRLKEEDGWHVKTDPGNKQYTNTLNITHNLWPPNGAAVGLSPFQENRQGIVLGVWCTPGGPVTAAQRRRLHDLLSPDPHGLSRTNNGQRLGWYPAYEYLSDLGYPLGDFSGREFFECARRIVRNESAGTFADDLATRLTDAALQADSVLKRQ
jgi:hypothetical protein